MKKLYFLRHGESEMNVSGHFAGHVDTPLTSKGRRQAEIAGETAKDMLIDLIVSSPLSRALETAQIFAKKTGYPSEKIIIEPALIERAYGELEGKPYTPELKLDGFTDLETNSMLIERAEKFIPKLKELEPDNILIVSHGSIGRAIRQVLIEDSDFHEQIPNAELVCWIEED